MNNTRATLANLTATAMIAYAVLTILTLIVQVLTVGTALATELGERFVQAGEAACATARQSGTRPPRPTPGFYGTTTSAYTASVGAR